MVRHNQVEVRQQRQRPGEAPASALVMLRSTSILSAVLLLNSLLASIEQEELSLYYH